MLFLFDPFRCAALALRSFRRRIDLNFVHSIDRGLVDGEVAAMVTYFLRNLLVEVLRAAAHCAVN